MNYHKGFFTGKSCKRWAFFLVGKTNPIGYLLRLKVTLKPSQTRIFINALAVSNYIRTSHSFTIQSRELHQTTHIYMVLAVDRRSGFLFVSESQCPCTETRQREGAPAPEDSTVPHNCTQKMDTVPIPDINLRASLKRDSRNFR